MKERLYVIFPYEKIEKDASIYIYGGGNVGKTLAFQIKKNNYCELKGFVDRNIKLETILGYAVISPQDIKDKEFDYLLIGIMDDRGIVEQLIKDGVDINKIITISKENLIEEEEFSIYPKIISNNGFLPEHLKYKSINTKDTLKKLIEKNININIQNNTYSILHHNASINEILITMMKYKRNIFYILDNNNYYLGYINLKDENAVNRISNNCSLTDILNKNVNNVVYYEDVIEDVVKKIYDTEFDEFLVLDKEDKLLFVWNRMNFYMTICDIKFDESNPVISRGYCQEKETYHLWEKYMYNVNSQNGEDGIIEEIFRRIGFDSKYCVEFGGWNGEYLSNTKNLIEKYKFQALFIEGNPERALEGIAKYAGKENQVHYAIGYVQHREGKLLDEFLNEDNAPINIDFMSIDIDGYDYHVWNSLKKYRPKVVCIEYNPIIGNDVIVIPPFDENRSVGASPLALVELGHKKGYSLVAVTKCNLIFVTNENFEKLKLPYNSLDLLRKFGSVNTCFVSFDGRVYNTGKIEDFFWTNNAPLEANELVVRKK